MSDNSNKDQPSSKSSHVPVPQPQHWQVPIAMGPAAAADYSQWAAAAAMWQSGIPPAHWSGGPTPPYNPYMAAAFLQQQQATRVMSQPTSARSSTNPSPGGTNNNESDQVKVIKPKESVIRPVPSPAGIQSPKPNSPGFLLGAAHRKEGFHAFSPYNNTKSEQTSRGPGTPNSQGTTTTTSTSGCIFTPNTGPFNIALPRKIHIEQGMDLSLSKSPTKSSLDEAPSTSSSADKKSAIPVGIAVARQRTAEPLPSPSTSSSSQERPRKRSKKTPAASSTTTTITTSSSTVTSSTSTVSNQLQSQSTVTNPTVSTSSMQSPWGPYPVPYVPNPYHHFTIAQPAVYMMPAHRPMFPPQPAPIPAQPGYFVQPNPMLIPELTVKTSQASSTTHASTSPGKPLSAASSPKGTRSASMAQQQNVMSPLDKAREKLHQINQRRESRQASPSNSEAKSVSSEGTERAAGDACDKSLHSDTSQSVKPCSRQPPKLANKLEHKNRSKQKDKTDSTQKPTEQPPLDFKLADPPKGKSETVAAKKGKGRAKLLQASEIDTTTNPRPSLSREFSRSIPLPVSELESPVSKSADDAVTSESSVCAITSETVISYSVEDETEVQITEEASKPGGAVKEIKTHRRKVPAQRVTRKRTRSADSEKVKQEASVIMRAASLNEEQPYLWAEDSLEPIIIKFDSTAYDLCQGEDLKQLELKLKRRMKVLNKQIQDHKEGMTREITPSSSFTSASTSSTSVSSNTSDSPVKERKSSFSVRSDSHPSLKMKMAAKAKSRARSTSQSEDKVKTVQEVKIPVTKSQTKVEPKVDISKFKEPLTPLIIPDPLPKCRRLTKSELLTTDSKILTNIEGLFYESRIKPIEPPDIYGIIIDGERHSKPRIFTEEELLNNTYTNVIAEHLSHLSVGTRVCAYWSELIGCLYPGTVTAIYPEGGVNSKHLIDIEFDDGDSGKFPLYQIRFLPHDYPHSHYDTSSVLPVGRRRTSTVPETPPIMISPPNNRSRVSAAAYNRSGQKSKALSSSSSSTTTTTTTTTTIKKRGPPRKSRKETKIPDNKSSDSSDSKSESSDTDDTDECDSNAGGATEEWQWVGTPVKKQARGRGSKDYYKAITRNGQTVKVGDCVLFQSDQSDIETDEPPPPYIGEILNMWEGWGGKMKVSVKWFYHPQELEVEVKLPKHKGALFESDHSDDNCVQTIKHRCQVLSYEDFVSATKSTNPQPESMFYLAGNYDAARRKVNRLYV